MSYRIYYTFRRDIFQGTLQINFMKRRIFTVEENIKRKVDLNVAGITISVITDEADIFVKAIEKKMDEEMKALLRNVRLSQFDAAMLCAIDFCADKLSAEKKLRNLEAQVSLYEVNLRRLKNEVNSLKKKLAENGEVVPAEAAAEEDADIPVIPDEQITIDEVISEGKSDSRSDKIRMIESLLKKN